MDIRREKKFPKDFGDPVLEDHAYRKFDLNAKPRKKHHSVFLSC